MAEFERNALEAEKSNPERYKSKDLEPGNRRYDLLVWDFHGTMTDHQLRLIRAFHHPGHEVFGIHFGKEFYQKAITRPSKKSKDGVSNLEFAEQEFRDIYSPEQIEWFKARYKGYMDSTYIPIPGTIEVLRTLLANRVDNAVLTNGTNREIVQSTLRKWGFEDFANKLYSSHNTGAKKPNTKPIEHILKDYGKAGRTFDRNRILLVGDSMIDSKTAGNIKADLALVVRGNGWESFQLIDPRPTYIVTEPSQIVEIVKGRFPRETRDFVEIPPMLWKRECWGKQTIVEEPQK
ncbi:MAG: hypothetical protein A2857_05025 [Candidatus Levybacteria bacterium RIFCSPHIGHO2_01_FULL_36_15]|nr:MAG: hypothetical protein A2857_05025 [Candidatus Levybacteria bacterium RIFCSPHIGHO2_01_FULL_36_15]OGH38147.1 MAG: hypothetical protein A2905_05190 [Candidatus Levybacteria bacterium RIFCSPLOWO2_01_FULL_36_10]